MNLNQFQLDEGMIKMFRREDSDVSLTSRHKQQSRNPFDFHSSSSDSVTFANETI